MVILQGLLHERRKEARDIDHEMPAVRRRTADRLKDLARKVRLNRAVALPRAIIWPWSNPGAVDLEITRPVDLHESRDKVGLAAATLPKPTVLGKSLITSL